MDKVRIDKWLWAARFFKTRSLAKQAIDGGKVQCDGQRVKASKDVTPGLTLTITRGFDKTEVTIVALSDQRRGAPEAQTLYEETPASKQRREQAAVERKAAGAAHAHFDHRPNKRERRLIHRFRDLLKDPE
ncbi:RNA-binding S4 domain-containing protein [Halioxenophilus sp. WMMB6]|uniref:RNA-binding S4 domain-containing protein n=1 Tax=Halioxenophilus sp. WMMB6 TaxID=3073815 RepID=UPI00295F4E4D|nr:S4 domain-containing protein [Halioxenophilus sp. WMMB6]